MVSMVPALDLQRRADRLFGQLESEKLAAEQELRRGNLARAHVFLDRAKQVEGYLNKASESLDNGIRRFIPNQS